MHDTDPQTPEARSLAVFADRDSFDSAIGDARPYGGKWQGTIFVLTHHPEDARYYGLDKRLQITRGRSHPC